MVVADLVQPLKEPKLLPKGTRIEVDFWYDSTPERGRQRGFDADTRALSLAITLQERHEAAMGSGEVVRLTEAAVIRLRTEVPLRFDDVTVATDNLAPDFPGSYGLWLKRGRRGWKLVFNHEADSWGTQHDPDFDAVQIDLEHSERGSAARPLGAARVPYGDGRGCLCIHWGAHDWSADFVIAHEPRDRQ